MSDRHPGRPSAIAPPDPERIGLPTDPDPELLAAARRLVGEHHPVAPGLRAGLSDAELRVAVLEAGIGIRHIAREVLIARNIRSLYRLDHLPVSESVEDLVRAGDMDERAWSFCFHVPADAIDAYLRTTCGTSP